MIIIDDSLMSWLMMITKLEQLVSWLINCLMNHTVSCLVMTKLRDQLVDDD